MTADVQHHYSDYGILTTDMFCEDCDLKGQSQRFLGVGAQNQSSRADQATKMIMYTARIFIMNTSLHWTDYGVDDLLLWYFTVKHMVWL